VAEVEGESVPSDRVVVRVNEGSGAPLFCVPGAADMPLQYRALARRLSGVAVYAFEYRGFARRALPDQTVAAIARRNVRAMRGVDPVGPYRLLGYSFGGVVALTMARQLTKAGHAVELLALLEPGLGPAGDSRSARARAFAGRVDARSVEAFPGHDLGARLRRMRRVTYAGGRLARRHLEASTAGLVARSGLSQREVFWQFHSRMLRAHRPKPYGGRTVVLASPKYFEDFGAVVDRLLPSERAGGDRSNVVVTGEHSDLVREPNVAEVARALELLVRPRDPDSSRSSRSIVPGERALGSD
jgi:thioesterase domain-containing protein